MVPAISHRAWRELIVGKTLITSSKLGFNLLLTNSRIYYRKESSETHLAVLIQHLYDYLGKYEGLYQEELKHIFGGDYAGLRFGGPG